MATRESTVRGNLSVLAAIADSRRSGLDVPTVCARLRISRATYYRALRELDRIRRHGQA